MLHRFILHNDRIQEASAQTLAAGQVGLLAGWGVFSTLRVAEGVPFAFERHWARIQRDAALFHVPLLEGPEALRSRLLELVEANHAYDSTLRVAIVRNGGGMWAGPSTGRASDLIALTADTKDWGHGVKLAVQAEARHAACEFAGTKILSWSMNLAWLENAQQRGFDEVILLNERGEISECTAANIFCVQEGRVLTPPLSSGCLEGVTRSLVLELGPAAGIEVEERTLFPEDIYCSDEVFISSTNRNVIGVAEIGGRATKTSLGPVTKRIDDAFTAYVRDYVDARAAVPKEP